MQSNNKSLEEPANVSHSGEYAASEGNEGRPAETFPSISEKGEPARFSAIIETFLIIVGLFAVFFLLPRNMKADGMTRYQTLLSLLFKHQLPDMKYSLIGPFFSLPLIWIGEQLDNPMGWALVYNQLLFAFT